MMRFFQAVGTKCVLCTIIAAGAVSLKNLIIALPDARMVISAFLLLANRGVISEGECTYQLDSKLIPTSSALTLSCFN